MTRSEAPPVPEGATLAIDPGTRDLGGGRLLGGRPRRMLRLSDGGRVAWAQLRDGVVGSSKAGVLARRLTDAGLAHPRPGVATGSDITVVVPVRDRAGYLDRCLDALGSDHRVIVVDDGSADPVGIATVVRRHGAGLLRREVAGGPAGARNVAIDDVASELVAFVDSDCRVPSDWLDRLAGHFADPAVGAVAPRVISARRDASGRYRHRCGLLDLGPDEARVQPLGVVGYVPTAALVVRRSALAEVGVFDRDLRYGEDVDLVWRLDAAGWRVRYDPAVEVFHDEPVDWPARLAKRFRYGSAAAPLAARHPASSAHLAGNPWPLGFVAAALARKPKAAAFAAVGTYLSTQQALRSANVSELSAARLTGESLAGTWRGVGRYATQFGLPLLAAAAVPRGRRTARIAMLSALAVAAPIAEHRVRRPGVALPRFVAGRIADDAAYGAGVYAGCAKQRSLAPLKVVVRRRGSEQ
ncbi:MAG TPA: mycofactocin biosynthesis glycosyltransferase MftF [Mycobacteriales bacterium]|nr:mycofactocin biosynthesis glycosyltransferase MftF [Mycobacteriales bacterium]HVX70918.1 mycofactocin biosynthesis glycosyltransferase MftF [Mycobacteriales bacterium]